MKLPPDVLFHHDLRLGVFRPRGVLNQKMIDQIVGFLEKEEEEGDKPFNRYTDLSHLKGIELDFDYVVRVSLHRRLSYMKHPAVKSAFYVTNEETAHLVNVHILMTEHSPLQCAIFQDVAEAAQWLGVSVENLQLGSENVESPN